MARHGIYPRDIIPPISDYFASGRFGRLFGRLPPFASDTPTARAALMEVGAPGGIMDPDDDLAAGPTLLITNPALSANNPNNPASTAGMTFLGQFLDHDMTFDPTVGPTTLNMTCAQATRLVASRGAVVLRTGPTTYDRYVRDSSFCAVQESARPDWVRTADVSQCPVGGVCRMREID